MVAARRSGRISSGERGQTPETDPRNGRTPETGEAGGATKSAPANRANATVELLRVGGEFQRVDRVQLFLRSIQGLTRSRQSMDSDLARPAMLIER